MCEESRSLSAAGDKLRLLRQLPRTRRVPIMDREDDNCSGEGGWLAGQAGQPTNLMKTRRRLVSGGLSAAPVLMALNARSALAQTCLTPSRAMSGNMSASNPVGTCTPGLSPDSWASPASFKDWPPGIAPSLQKCTTSSVFKKKGNGCEVKTASAWAAYTDTLVPPIDAPNRFIFGVPTDCPNNSQDYQGGPQSTTPATLRINPQSPNFGATFAGIFGDAFVNTDFLPKIPTFVNDSTVPTKDDLRKVSLWELLAYPYWGLSATQLDLARCCIAAYLNASVPGNQYPVTASQAIQMWRKGRLGKNYCALDSCVDYWGEAEIVAYLKETWT
jgi:hypothetical protein